MKYLKKLVIWFLPKHHTKKTELSIHEIESYHETMNRLEENRFKALSYPMRFLDDDGIFNRRSNHY